jgi:di/tricarboxylate transporter
MNSAATAAIMSPIAIGTAATLGASGAFLTPIGPQNNTLFPGPGEFRLGDCWRLGLPLEIVVVVINLPVLLKAWPL